MLIPGYRPLFEMQAILKCFYSQLPVMLRPEGYERLVRPKSARTFLRATYLSWIYNRVAAYLAVGSRSKQHFLAHGGNSSKIVSSPYCVYNDFFQTGANKIKMQRDSLRKKMNIDRDAFVVVYVGKMIPRKRPLVLAEGICRSRHRDKIHVIWVGSGPLLQDVKNFTGTHNLASTFAGFANQSELAQYYGAADLHILSSVEETWGLVVNEIMNFSLPQIVRVGAGCGDDLIAGKGTGFVIPVDDSDALAAKIDWFIENNEKRMQMSRRCLEVINEWGLKEAADGVIAGANRVVAG